MRKMMSSMGRHAGFLLLGMVLSACSADRGEDGAVERASDPAQGLGLGATGEGAGAPNPLHQHRQVPQGELDDADAKLAFRLRGCNACHEVDEQRIGPPYRAIALRYAADHASDPLARENALAAKIRFGGAGAWGVVPMISNPSISQDEAISIARWIMRLQQAPAATGSP